jgi:hypothetical protein
MFFSLVCTQLTSQDFAMFCISLTAAFLATSVEKLAIETAFIAELVNQSPHSLLS